MATSQNGFRANDRSLITSYTIPGTDRKASLRKGPAGELLITFAAWFDKNIESVDGGILDDWGYAERTIRGSSTTLSNHASGTALDINAPRHPLGKRNTFTPEQARKIRAELARYEGAIRWGGDYQNRADEMHFEVNADEATCRRVLAKVTAKVIPKENPLSPSLRFKAGLLAVCKAAVSGPDAVPKSRKAVHVARRAVEAIANRIK